MPRLDVIPGHPEAEERVNTLSQVVQEAPATAARWLWEFGGVAEYPTAPVLDRLEVYEGAGLDHPTYVDKLRTATAQVIDHGDYDWVKADARTDLMMRTHAQLISKHLGAVPTEQLWSHFLSLYAMSVALDKTADTPHSSPGANN